MTEFEANNMPSTNFAKDIASVFNSELTEKIKHDLACRLVCDALNASSVSVLIYTGTHGKLICNGSYLNPERANINDPVLKEILENIACFDFFDSVYHGRRPKDIYSSFLQSCIYGSNTDTVGIEDFAGLREKWMHNPVYKKKYKSYKENFTTDAYEIDHKTVSGSYFKELIKTPFLQTIQERIVDLEFAPQRLGTDNRYFHVMTNVGIDISESAYYIGLPLFANERYWGVLRIIISNVGVTDIIKNTKDDELALTAVYAERLRNFAQLVSLNFESYYFLNGYKTLSTLEINRKNLSNICEDIVIILNCLGGLIRLKNRDTNEIEIAGYSAKIKSYVDFLKSDDLEEQGIDSDEFSSSLIGIFKKERYGDSEIKAITFSIKDLDSNKFDTVEYYYDDQKELRKEENSRTLDDFGPVYNQKLLDFNISEVAVLQMPLIEDGYVILMNAEFRPFTSSDIEMVLVAIKRIALEIKHDQDFLNIQAIEKQQAFMTTMRIVVHQFGNLVSIASNSIYNLTRNKLLRPNFLDKEHQFDIDNFRKKVGLLNFVISQSKRQLLWGKRLMELEGNQKLVPQNTKVDDFKGYVFNKCKDYEANAVAIKGLHVWFIEKGESIRSFDTDPNLFDEVLSNLLDNAIKYSYESSEMKKRVSEFDELRFHTNGNILVSYNNTYDGVTIEVSNWGIPIPPEDKNKIYNNYYRGKNSRDVVGSGIGLFLVKKIMDAMNGTIDYTSAKDKTTFSLYFKR